MARVHCDCIGHGLPVGNGGRRRCLARKSGRLGTRFAQALMADVAAGGILVWDIPRAQLAKVPAMMRKYASLPMDLADASLVLLAKHLGHGKY